MGGLYSVETSLLLFVIFPQIFYTIITFLISMLSFKIYNITKQNQPASISIAFFFISLSYGVQAFFNILIFLNIRHELYVMFGIHPLSVFNNFGVYFHAVFMLIGLATLSYITFRSNDKSVLWVLMLSSFIVIFLSRDVLLGFFMITSLYLGTLFYHFLTNCHKKKNRKEPLLIAFGFLFLFLGHIAFIFIRANLWFYYFGHLLTFIGYFLMLLNLILVLKK